MEYQQYNPTNEEVNSNSNTYSEAVDGAGVNAFVNALIDGEGSGLATVSAEAYALGGTTFNECTDLFSLPKLLDADGTGTGVGSTQTSPRPTAVLPIVPTITTCPHSSVPTGPTGQTLVSPPTIPKTYSSTAEFAAMIIAIWIGSVIANDTLAVLVLECVFAIAYAAICILKYIHTTILAAYDDNDDLVTPFQSLRDELRPRILEHESIGRFFQQVSLFLDNNTIPRILNCIDYFLSQSRGSESTITTLGFYPDAYLNSHAFSDHDDDVWDKLGQAVGNLLGLKNLIIIAGGRAISNHGDEGVSNFDWERLARILCHVRQNVTIMLVDSERWNAEEMQALARALPTLTTVALSHRRQHAQLKDEVALSHPEILTELLRVPSLRYVSFRGFSFTPALCQAAANAFMEGTAVTTLGFGDCSFSTGESAAILLNGLSRNTSVTSIRVHGDVGRAFLGALAAALPLNSTLQKLS